MSTSLLHTEPTEPSDIYECISSYDFASDTEFRKGLGTILGHPESPASESELLSEDHTVLQAKCFYISRKKNVNPPIDFFAYKNWLQANEGRTQSPASQVQEASKATVRNTIQPPDNNTSASSLPGAAHDDTEPTYPSSFSHIVELITNGQPIPGIEDIPDTVLSGYEEPSKVARRLKPWEKTEAENGSI